MNVIPWQVRSRLELAFDGPLAWTLASAIVLVVTFAFALSWGAVDVQPATLVSAITDADHPLHRVLWDVRVPRILCGVLVGTSLAVAGALLQTAVRNPLADPSILGVTAGAGVGALVVILLWPGHSEWIPWSAFAGGLATIVCLIGLAWSRGGETGALRIVLSGVALQAILFAVMGLLTFLFADRAPSFAGFVVGSLNGSGWSDVSLMAWPISLGLIGSALMIRSLDLLLLDDGAASGVGVSVVQARFLAACLAAMLTAAAVSAAGLVGFVGLVVPNGMRLLVGPEHGVLLPATALTGATLVLLADGAARSAFAPIELPVGALLALVGGPYFLWILWKKLP